MPICNIAYAWVEHLRPVTDLNGFPARSIERYIRGWTGPKRSLYFHVFVMPKIHEDRTYRTQISFASHEDSYKPRVISSEIAIWKHDNPGWQVMYQSPVSSQDLEANYGHRTSADKEIHKLHEEKKANELYYALLKPEELRLIELITRIDHRSAM